MKRRLNAGHDAEALAIAERASSRGLLDELGGGRVPALAHAPDDLVREKKKNRDQLDALFARLRTLSDEPQKNSDRNRGEAAGQRYAGGADARIEWRICFAVGGAAGNFRRDRGTYGAALGSGKILGGRRCNLSVADHPRRIPQFRHPCDVGTDPSLGGQLGGKLRGAQRTETGRRVG